MKTILTHWCYEGFLGKERISNHQVGNLLQLVFSADKVTAVPIHAYNPLYSRTKSNQSKVSYDQTWEYRKDQWR